LYWTHANREPGNEDLREPAVERAADYLPDLGNLLLAFVMFWAYVSFSQFLLIWAGNLPEEVRWYVPRTTGIWKWVAILLAGCEFALPFVLLLSRAIKRDPGSLAKVAALVLTIHLVDLIWQIIPTFISHDETSSFIDSLAALAATLGLGGLWIAAWLQRPEKDARPTVNGRNSKGAGTCLSRESRPLLQYTRIATTSELTRTCEAYSYLPRRCAVLIAVGFAVSERVFNVLAPHSTGGEAATGTQRGRNQLPPPPRLEGLETLVHEAPSHRVSPSPDYGWVDETMEIVRNSSRPSVGNFVDRLPSRSPVKGDGNARWSDGDDPPIPANSGPPHQEDRAMTLRARRFRAAIVIIWLAATVQSVAQMIAGCRRN